MGWEIPEMASDILEGQNELRILRANTLLVIRDCNKVTIVNLLAFIFKNWSNYA